MRFAHGIHNEAVEFYRFGMAMEATDAGDSETLAKLRYPGSSLRY